MPHIASGYLNLAVATIAWGSIGFAIATVTKNAGTAIGAGVGWSLLVEPILSMASERVGDYLPGGTIGAVASGGTPNLSWSVALVIAVVYIAAATTVAWLTIRSRDITD